MIERVLIANRGEIACRIARTCRRLGIGTVAVFSDADADALHVRRLRHRRAPARHARRPTPTCAPTCSSTPPAAPAPTPSTPATGSSPSRRRSPGPSIDAGLTWIGPPPAAIAAMGSKIEAKALMRAAGVPVLPDSTVEGADDLDADRLPDARQGVGRRRRAGHAHRASRRRARRRPRADAEREAAAAFGDGTVFCERYVERGRHVEIQVFADTHGNVVVAARAGVLDPAPPPEDRRGVAVARPSTTTLRRRMADAADRRRPRRRLRRRRHGRVPARPGRRVLVPRDEHPAAGRAPGHRARHRARPRRAAARRRRGRDRCRPAASTPRSTATPSRSASPPRTRPPATARRRARSAASTSPGDVRVDTGIAVRLDRVAVLRLDGRQGHRPRRRPGTAAIRTLVDALRRARLHGPVTNRDQLLASSAPGVRRRRPAHRVPRRAPVHRPDRRRRARSPRRPSRWPSRPPTGPPPACSPASRRAGATTRPSTSASSWPTTTRRSRVTYRLGRDRPRRRRRRAARRRRRRAPAPDAVVFDVAGVRRTLRRRARRRPPLRRRRRRPRHVHACCPATPTRRPPSPPARSSPRCPATCCACSSPPGDAVTAGQPLVVVEAMKMEHQIARPGRRHGRGRARRRRATRSRPASCCCTWRRPT